MCTITPQDVVSIVTGIVEVVGMVQYNKAQNVKAKYRVEQLKTQAKNAQKEAAFERQEGIEDSRRKKLQSILMMSKEASKFAAGNIALSSQTAINAVDDVKLSGELDALNTLKVSEKRAEAYERQANEYYKNAALTAFNAKVSTKNNIFSASTRILNYGKNYYKKNEKVINQKFKEWKNAK